MCKIVEGSDKDKGGAHESGERREPYDAREGKESNESFFELSAVLQSWCFVPCLFTKPTDLCHGKCSTKTLYRTRNVLSLLRDDCYKH